MLKKFTVSNYRVFENTMTLDFSNTRDYKFNCDCIKNNIVHKAVIYGKNAVGKTNLGEALLDISMMIPGPGADLAKQQARSKSAGYLNAKSSEKTAKFEYIFDFDKNILEYTYGKDDIDKISFESIKINDKLLYYYDYAYNIGDFSRFGENPLLFDNWNKENSFLSNLLSFDLPDELKIIKDLEKFIVGMFNMQALFMGNGSTGKIRDFTLKYIIEANLVEDFTTFLSESGVQIKLKSAKSPTGKNILYFDYGDSLLPFKNYASSGTLSLLTLYAVLVIMKPSFLYIDEFDANFHFDVAKLILGKFNKESDCQLVITTHNTDLMSNKFMRPDCYFIMYPDQLQSLADSTKRELREGHNLEKLYQGGEFDLPEKKGDPNG